MIYLITGRRSKYDQSELEANGIKFAKGRDFSNWIENYDKMIQLDTETNIVEGLYGWKGHLKGKNKRFVEDLDEDGNRIPCERECYVVQVGDFEGKDQWIFDVPGLKDAQKAAMFKTFTCNNKKLIHNCLFDYGVVKWNFGIDMKHMVDTMLMSESTVTGLEVGKDLPKGYNGLAGCAHRYLGLDLSKVSQTTFTGEPMTVKQIEYAAIDVTILGPMYPALERDVEMWGAQNVVLLESALMRSYGDAMCDNLYLDPKPWSVQMNAQFNEVARLEEEFFELMNQHFYDEIREKINVRAPNPDYKKDKSLDKYVEKVLPPFVQKHDEYQFIKEKVWTGRAKKKEIMFYLYPDMPKNYTTQKEYEGYYELISEMDDGPNPKYLGWLLNKNYESLELYLISKHKKWLTDNSIFVAKDTILINLNSPDQKLALFQLIDPKINSTDKEVINKIKHPLAYKLKEYNKASKLSTSYGQNFLDAINPDGMFRVKNFTPILNTGRSSMSMLQLLPGKSEYRNPFLPNHPDTGVRDDGKKWVVVGADYASQEAVVAATFCKEESLLKAIGNGQDFHSTCAQLMFPDEWARLGGDPFPKDKPKDKTLLGLRQSSKVTSFGLFYGKSAIGLGESLNIPATTVDLIEGWPAEYEQFMLDNADEYKAYHRGYSTSGRNTKAARHAYIKIKHKEGLFLPDIVTADDLVDRFYATFPNIHSYLTQQADQAAIDKYIRTPDPVGRVRRFAYPEHDGDISAIKRAAMNMPIQGASANMTKFAICLIKNYIEENDLGHKFKFCLPLHDEVRYICHEEFAEEALEIIIDKMEEAAEYILDNTLLKAEGEITEVWFK